MELKNNYLIEHPIFILNSPRSGSTLLRLILNSNSKISIPNEFILVEKIITTFSNNDEISKKAAIDFINKISDLKKFKDWNIDVGKLITKANENNFYTRNHLIQLIYSFYTKQYNGKKVWGDKNIHSLSYLKDIVSIFPEARFIHIVRDGRDVALSLKKVGWLFYKFPTKKRHYINNIKGCALTWNDSLELIEENEHLFDSNNFIEINYEFLVKEPKKALNSLCSFLKIDFEDKMLDFHENNSISKERLALTHKNTKKPILKDNFNKYLKFLSKNEIQIFEHYSSKMLLKYGYEINFNKEDLSKVKIILNNIKYLINFNVIYFLFKVKSYVKN